MAAQLFTHESIETTEAKAKALRPYAEKLITKAKRGDLAARREVLKDIPDRDVVAHLFHEIGPRFEERNGGYTRILKLGPRKGDAAPDGADRTGRARLGRRPSGCIRRPMTGRTIRLLLAYDGTGFRGLGGARDHADPDRRGDARRRS